MGKKIKLFKSSTVSEDGYVVNPEAKKQPGDNLQKPAQSAQKPINNVAPKNKPLEDYKPENIADTFEAMHTMAVMAAARAKGDMVEVRVSDTKFEGDIRYFSIMHDKKGFVVYQVERYICYRDASEFVQLMKEIKDKVPGRTIDSLKMSYRDPSKQLQLYNVKQREDCFFIIASIFSSLTGKSYCQIEKGVNEKNCKIIRHNKLGTDGLAKKSVAFKEAKYGTEEENNFKQELEDKQKQEPSVVGCLDQQQQEEGVRIVKTGSNDANDSEQPKVVLPNAHRKIQESVEAPVADDQAKQIVWNGNDYIWEAGDYVFVRFWKSTDRRHRDFNAYRGQVIAASDPVNQDDKQVVIVLVMGHTLEIDPMDIAPDMTIEVQRNRFRDCPGEMVDDAEKKFSGNPDGKSDEEYLDHNQDKYIYGNIAFRGNRLTFAPVQINLKDISESKKSIRVINEFVDKPFLVDVDNLETDDYVWAVVVDADNTDADNAEEPIRKIKIDPISYVNADAESDGPEGMVDCLIGDKESKMLKKNIKIMS